MLAGRDGGLRIAAVDPAAARHNLKAGMSLADARAQVANLRVAEADPQADAELLRVCAAACEMFTPLVALDGGDGLLLDITGCVHLFGGEEGLRVRAGARLAGFGLAVRAAVAGTPDAAQVFARFARIGIVPPGDEESLARGLPVAALDRDAETTLALTRAGLKTLGDLAARPAGVLAARFGAGLVARLGRILGREDIRITPLRAVPACLAERHFPEPMLEMAALEQALARLARDICMVLESRGQGGRQFEASFFRTDGAVRRIAIETGAPCRDAATLLRLAGLKIAALADPLDPGFGFDAIRFGVLHAEALDLRQAALDGKTDGNGDAGALADRLAARFGRDRVLRFAARDAHDPARAATHVPAQSDAPLSPWPRPEAGEPPARPLTLFRHPQLVEALAEVPDGPPLRFRWRRVLHDVARAEGPERIAPEWWLEGACAPATRDYYRIEDGEGRRFWVFREGFYEDSTARPRWFVHGLFA